MRRFWIPAFAGMTKISSASMISSHARKRESSLPFPQEKHRRVLRASPLDSRFRGNDEVLVVSPDFFTHSFAGMTKYCRRGIAFIYGKSSASLPLFVRDVQFPRTLFRGSDRGARSSRRRLALPPDIEPNRQPPATGPRKNPGLVQKSRFRRRRFGSGHCRSSRASRNVVSAETVSAGRSCWTQWPAPSMRSNSWKRGQAARIRSSAPGR